MGILFIRSPAAQTPLRKYSPWRLCSSLCWPSAPLLSLRKKWPTRKLMSSSRLPSVTATLTEALPTSPPPPLTSPPPSNTSLPPQPPSTGDTPPVCPLTATVPTPTPLGPILTPPVSTPVPTSVLLPSLTPQLPPPTSPEPTLTHTTTATLTLPSLLPRRKNRFFYSPQSASKRLPAKFPAKINMNRPIKKC